MLQAQCCVLNRRPHLRANAFKDVWPFRIVRVDFDPAHGSRGLIESTAIFIENNLSGMITVLASRRRRAFLPIMLSAAAAITAHAQGPRLTPLDSNAVSAIAALLLLEDTRAFDSAAIAGALNASHQEVRRRALLAMAHINDKRGIPLLRAFSPGNDTTLAATAVFAVGQLRDTLTIPWLDSLLANPRTHVHRAD